MKNKSDNASGRNNSDMRSLVKIFVVLLVFILGVLFWLLPSRTPDSSPQPEYHRYVAYVQIIHGNTVDDAIRDNLVKIPTDDVNICKAKRRNPNVGSCHIRPVNSYDYSTRVNPEIAGDHGEF